MSTSKEICSIREWAPLTNIIDLIPQNLQRGLFSTNLNVTCVDAIPEYLALGTDSGTIFWYNRQTGEMQKLKAEVSTCITCIKIVNSVDYMVAGGSANGQVSVYQIQKELPIELELVAPCTRQKPIQRYTIRASHKSVVSCLEWSKNGMKLYSGDRHGIVVLTEFDYSTQLCKSQEIISEAYEIVQLSLYQSYLLVATLYRCIICQRNPGGAGGEEWLIHQVGKKDRKHLIDCGAIFQKQQSTTAPPPPQLICGRPGLRFWLADLNGNVSKTLLFKDAVLSSPTWEIPILNPKSRGGHPLSAAEATMSESIVASSNFRELQWYSSDPPLLVTHDDTALYILNLDRLRVEAVARGFRKILHFCVCDKEIFVLEGDRMLIRLAPMPEKPNKMAKVIFNPLMPPPVPLMGSSHYNNHESPVEEEVEECFETPPIEKLNLNVSIELAVESPLAEQNRRLEIFRRIGEMDFDQSILHKKHKQTTATTSGGGGIVEIGHESQECKLIERQQQQQQQLTTAAATLMEASYCQMENNGLPSPTIDLNVSFQEPMNSTSIVDKPEMPSTSEALTPSLAQMNQSLLSCYPTTTEIVETTTNSSSSSCKDADSQEINLCSDYTTGQPIDGICSMPPKTPLQFVQTQPEADSQTSFLPDFRLAADPLQPPVVSSESRKNSSSEWEFLDN